MTKMIGHVEYANDEKEATELLIAYSDEIGLPWGVIPLAKWAASVRIAHTESDKNGLVAAKKTLDDDLFEQRRAERVAAREAAIEGQGDSLVKAAGAKTLAGSLLAQCQHHYGQANNPSFTFGPGMSEADYAAFQTEWSELGELADERGYDQFTDFYALDIQNKAALGKKQVGDTLATRGWQGNVFVTILGARFNAHIDIKKKK
ncbi:hypothetical protein GCM10010277_68170 [Streptomyces longisporoflavus]|uniref:hypothetical protein n=1 Tax=Streptomyces longisporoflavus TaxID=28044 RepID=UPI00167D371B|nr:hypothetical protein [Streptomyces longisporoflavus]GGV62615.1 hypothetical protein GCM10010277_68170 [Streptomyces longisporoflavus]